MRHLKSAALAAVSLFVTGTAQAQNEAMEKLSFLHGEWRGEAVIYDQDGTKTDLVQTERVGPMVGGNTLLIEGRGFDGEALVFNALGMIVHDPATDAYRMHSVTLENESGVFPMDVRQNGFEWSIPAGPGGTVIFTATVEDDRWVEEGRYVHEEYGTFPVMSMDLERVDDTDWPSANAVGAQ